jgi:hypothetical protein
MCVLPAPGLVVVSIVRKQRLTVYDLTTGKLHGALGSGQSSNDETSFHMTTGGLCATPNPHTLLVADGNNGRVVEVNALTGAFTRTIAVDRDACPCHVDCNSDVVVVACAPPTLYIASWSDGALVTRLRWPNTGVALSVRLLPDAGGILLATKYRNTVMVLTMEGVVRWQRCTGVSTAIAAFRSDFLLPSPDDDDPTLDRIAWRSKKVIDSVATNRLHIHSAKVLQALPNGGLAVLGVGVHHGRVVVLKGLDLRMAWLHLVNRVLRQRPNVRTADSTAAKRMR